MYVRHLKVNKFGDGVLVGKGKLAVTRGVEACYVRQKEVTLCLDLCGRGHHHSP